MQFLPTTNLLDKTCDLIIIGIDESKKISKKAQIIDEKTNHSISNALSEGLFSGKSEETCIIKLNESKNVKKALLVGLGKPENYNIHVFRKCVAASAKQIQSHEAKTVISLLHDHSVPNHDEVWTMGESVLAFSHALYELNTYKSDNTNKNKLETLYFSLPDECNEATAEKLLQEKSAIAQGVQLARDLGNAPPNICTPSYLAEQALALAKTCDELTVKIISEDEAKKLGMGAFVAVSQGSAQDGKVIIMEYRGADKATPATAFVGKGMTFDTGGVNIKQPQGMIDMKYDMCGAATVFGIIKAAIEAKLPLNIIGAVASAENMPSGTACRPSDIITTLSGKTVEITNTDAEGRLVLCDALTYVKDNYQPEKIIDIATLTGAAIVSLGHHRSALMANSQALADALLKAGETAEDLAWQLPIDDTYKEQLKAQFSDIKNWHEGIDAGSITAACYLSHFTEGTDWAHLDIAGTSSIWGKRGQATGRPVPLLMQYLLSQINEGKHATH